MFSQRRGYEVLALCIQAQHIAQKVRSVAEPLFGHEQPLFGREMVEGVGLSHLTEALLRRVQSKSPLRQGDNRASLKFSFVGNGSRCSVLR